MKKLLAVFLTVVLVFSLSCAAFAVSTSDITLNYLLTYNGKHAETVSTGEEITVEYAVENITNDDDFTVYTIQNEIFYDHNFFEFVEGSFNMEIPSVSASVKKTEGPNNKLIREIYINDGSTREYKNHQVVGTFKLKVISTSGSSTIKNNEIIAYADGSTKYGVSGSLGDLTITVGTTAPEIFTISYVSNGTTVTEQRADGEPMTIPNGPSEAPQGKVFDYWKTNDGKQYNPGDIYTVTGDVAFTAVWRDNEEPKKNYTITFDTNGGSAIGPVTEPEGTVIDLSQSQYTPKRSGYTFGGWYSDATLKTPISSITVGENTTVYAKWTKNSSTSVGVAKFTLSFNTNGGSAIADVVKVRNTTVDLSKYITRKAGFTFEGWYTDAALTNKVTEVKMTSDITLYAKWTEGESGEGENPNYSPDIMTDKHYAYIMGRDGGMIYPQANLTRAEAATIFFRLLDENVRAESMTKINVFADVNAGDWHNTAISTLANLEILNGRSTDTFAPNEPITRAELTTIVARLSEASYTGASLFGDIDSHWAESYINIAASIGWVNGDNGKFRPNDNITRAEVMTLVNRALNRQPETKEDLLDGMKTWPDNSNESAWYYLAVQEATNSHDYEMKSDGVHEKWTKLTENPDWSQLEG